jgi:hypothetical protein
MTKRGRRRRRVDMRGRVYVIDGPGVNESVGYGKREMKRMTTMNTFCYC